MFTPGEIVSYIDMCREEGASLQHGMNYRLHGKISVVLMSRRRRAPYKDELREDGRVLIYEGHDIARSRNGPDPKLVDQPIKTPSGRLSRNGLFYEAARNAATGKTLSERVRVYEKIKEGIWVFNSLFSLTDAYLQSDGKRMVFKFRLEISPEEAGTSLQDIELPHTRVIPSSVKFEVWKRDRGRCVHCGRSDNLHFDHIVPFSKGGASVTAMNVQLLCARHNLEKRDRIA